MKKSADDVRSIMQAICSRPNMYFQPNDSTAALNFVNGFMTGTFVCGIDLNQNWQAAEEERGWTNLACGPIPQMQQRGLMDDAIADELLAILSLAVEKSLA